ncbi:MAG: hypothetical protein CMQ57_00965 [Gammaproteobacteria bacterium]|nr:hypothetical protein [Gammaproteobacteria bacterium]|tara:strand:- start:13433 stop:14143 length:711 start_codon:yes stop_codon:yes gene_type:complete
MRSFEDYIIEYPNVVSKELCDEIIDRFEADEKVKPGKSGAGLTNSKISDDLLITGDPKWDDIDDVLYKAFNPYFTNYMDLLIKDAHYSEPMMFHDRGYQIQRTTPGGHYHWHDDASSEVVPLRSFIHKETDYEVAFVNNRIFTYILYLNDRSDQLDNGKTQFYNCGVSKNIISEPGKLLLFPSSQFWTHRGEELTSGVKYLLTGWCCRYGTYRVCNAGGNDFTEIAEHISMMEKTI